MKETPLQRSKRQDERLKEVNKRRLSKKDNFSEVIYTRVGDVQLPPETFHQRVQYDFLQYIRIAFNWACTSHDISRPYLELLLYIYPIGLFKRTDIEIFTRTLDMKYARVFNKLVEDGWVVLWRAKKGRQSALYTLSTKGKILCGKLHKICTGESQIPETSHNALVSSSKTVDKYYMNVIKQMNKKKE
jgi:hypothetical protein